VTPSEQIRWFAGEIIEAGQGVISLAALGEVLREAKSAHIERLCGQSKRVAIVGDGVNTAPALSTADVSIAAVAEPDDGVEAGVVGLVRSDSRRVAHFLTHFPMSCARQRFSDVPPRVPPHYANDTKNCPDNLGDSFN